MVVSSFSPPTFYALDYLAKKQPISIDVKRTADAEIKADEVSKVEEVEESRSQVAQMGDSIQKSSIDIEDYSTYNTKKQIDEQGLLRSDSSERIVIKTDHMRHQFLGQNISLLV